MANIRYDAAGNPAALPPRALVGGIAQLVEHRPFKPLVLGSNPSAPTIIHFARVGFAGPFWQDIADK